MQAFGAPNMSAAKSIADLFLLARPESVLDLEPEEMIVQTQGDDAFIARRPDYLSVPAFAKRFDANPLHQTAPLPKRPIKPVKRKKNVYPRQEEEKKSESVDDKLEAILKRYG